MRPPRGFTSELYPLRHRLDHSFGLSAVTATKNSAFITLVRHTSDVIAGTPGSLIVNPHHASFVGHDPGPAVGKMSIIDKLSMSLRFNLTEECSPVAHTSGVSGAEVFSGDDIKHLKLSWRPVFFSFGEKLDAVDDSTSVSVATILGLTHDATYEDVVPLTTTKLPSTGISDKAIPVSTKNIVEVFDDDYNMTTNTTYEDHPWDEDLFQKALKYYTNKGALRACVGRTRTVHLSIARPYKSYYLNKFVPRAIRRVVPYTFMGIQINLPIASDDTQDYFSRDLTANVAHVGVKCITHFHEWNTDHYQEMSGTPP